MSNDLVLAADVNVDELGRIGKMLAVSGYFDQDRNIDRAIAQMAVKVMAGRELGYGPFASANGIHIIKGKPAVSANLMAAAVKAHPQYDYRVRAMDDSAVSVEFFQDGESIGVSSFSIDDAKSAGLMSNNTWKSYPRNMLFARAISNGVRWYCPDVFAGNAVYVPEELGADVDENGDVVEYRVADAQPQPVQIEEPRPEFSMADVEPVEVPPKDAEPSHDENGNGTLPAKLRKKLHAVGQETYGDEWDKERHRICTKKYKVDSSNKLSEAQAEEFIAGMKAKQAEPVPA